MPINPARYPENWKEISLRIRFEVDEGKCRFCGAEHGKQHPITGSLVILTTAHLDHKLTDHSDENLAALCQRCHLNFDRKYANQSRKYGKEYLDIQLSLDLL